MSDSKPFPGGTSKDSDGRAGRPIDEDRKTPDVRAKGAAADPAETLDFESLVAPTSLSESVDASQSPPGGSAEGRESSVPPSMPTIVFGQNSSRPADDSVEPARQSSNSAAPNLFCDQGQSEAGDGATDPNDTTSSFPRELPAARAATPGTPPDLNNPPGRSDDLPTAEKSTDAVVPIGVTPTLVVGDRTTDESPPFSQEDTDATPFFSKSSQHDDTNATDREKPVSGPTPTMVLGDAARPAKTAEVNPVPAEPSPKIDEQVSSCEQPDHHEQPSPRHESTLAFGSTNSKSANSSAEIQGSGAIESKASQSSPQTIVLNDSGSTESTLSMNRPQGAAEEEAGFIPGPTQTMPLDSEISPPANSAPGNSQTAFDFFAAISDDNFSNASGARDAHDPKSTASIGSDLTRAEKTDFGNDDKPNAETSGTLQNRPDKPKVAGPNDPADAASQPMVQSNANASLHPTSRRSQVNPTQQFPEPSARRDVPKPRGDVELTSNEGSVFSDILSESTPTLNTNAGSKADDVRFGHKPESKPVSRQDDHAILIQRTTWALGFALVNVIISVSCASQSVTVVSLPYVCSVVTLGLGSLSFCYYNRLLKSLQPEV